MYPLKELVQPLFAVQSLLNRNGIQSFVGGGVGVDLLALKYTPQVSPRPHQDLDIYVPLIQRGESLKYLTELGCVDPFSFENCAHAIACLGAIKCDVFSIDGSGLHTRVLNASYAGILAQRAGGERGRDIPISLESQSVACGRVRFRVLGPAPQLQILRRLSSPNAQTRRDIRVLEEVVISQYA